MPYTWPVTLTEIKAETNISASTDDGELQTVIDAATAILVNHPSYRVGDVINTGPYTEWHDGGGPTVLLRHYPVNPGSVTVTEYHGTTSQAVAYEPSDGGSFTGYGYYLDPDTGELFRTSDGVPYRWSGRVKVVYSTATVDVPADLRTAALLLVDHLWETQRGTQAGGLPAGLDPDMAPGTFGERYGPSFILPYRVQEALLAYQREPNVA